MEVTVTTLTTTVLVIGAAVETNWLDELPATMTVLEGKILVDETTKGITLDADDGSIESMTLDADDGMIEVAILDAEVGTTWLSALLTNAREDAGDTVFELSEEA